MWADSRYLYRGTTRGWTGTEALQNTGVSPTTTDPLVATLFAIECRNHGPGTVLVIPQEPLAGLIGKANYFSIIECAVNIMLPPTELLRYAVLELQVDRSVAILAEIGFGRLPQRIASGSFLTVLNDTHAASHRLSIEQIRQFNRRIFEVEP
jgi:hypothetical protein